MKHLILLLFLQVLTKIIRAQATPKSINGEWLSAKKDTRVVIYQQGPHYVGKITWGMGSPTRDVTNPDPTLRNRSLIGLVILRDFTYDGQGSWEGGSIYDPRQGKTYTCKMTLKTPNSLSIRGYVGLPLFGRTEVWSRVNDSLK